MPVARQSWALLLCIIKLFWIFDATRLLNEWTMSGMIFQRSRLSSWTFYHAPLFFDIKKRHSSPWTSSVIFWILWFLFLIFKFVSSQCANTVERFIRFRNFIKKFFNKYARWDESSLSVYILLCEFRESGMFSVNCNLLLDFTFYETGRTCCLLKHRLSKCAAWARIIHFIIGEFFLITLLETRSIERRRMHLENVHDNARRVLTIFPLRYVSSLIEIKVHRQATRD